MLNEVEISEGAERVWHYLDDRGASTPQRINKTLKLDLVLLYMSIRKLAREEKIVFNDHRKELQVSLAGRQPLLAMCKALAAGNGRVVAGRKPHQHAIEGGRP